MKFEWKRPRFSILTLLLTAIVSALIGGFSAQHFGSGASSKELVSSAVGSTPTMLGERTSAEPPSVQKAAKTLEDWLIISQQTPTTAQVEAFLESRGRDAESLVSMFKLTNDQTLLREAMRDYPDDVLVQATVVLNQAESGPELRKWADRWVESDPDNALARYLLAGAKAKDEPARAVEDLVAAISLHRKDNHRAGMLINQSAFYESIGMPSAIAQVAAATKLGTPEIGPIRKTAVAISNYAIQQREGGATEEADRAIAATLAMGQRFTQDSTTILESLVGLSMEKIALRGVDPDGGPPAFLDRSVEEYQASLEASSDELRGVMKQYDWLESIQTMTEEPQLLEYMRRLQQIGELPALKWLDRQLQGNPSQKQ